MKILHCCLSSFYNENYNYQENMLPRQNKADGHEVMILASTEVFVNNKEIGYVDPEEYINKDGVRVIRVPYKKIINDQFSHKFRAYKGVYGILEDFKPDIILFHGMSAWELLTIKKYVKKNCVKLFIDNHANYLNSAQGRFSLYVLHKLFYKNILRQVLPYTQQVLCVGFREMEFAKTLYGVGEEKLKHYPLGGNIISDDEYLKRREKTRNELRIGKNELVFLHSGKMNKAKMTDQLVKEFKKINEKDWHLLIAGSLLEDIKVDVEQVLNQDNRISYLGWKSAEELVDLMCASDVYLQPGSPSSTLQTAMCCRCAIMAQPIEEYRFLLQEYGLYVQSSTDIYSIFEQISKEKIAVSQYSERTFEQAKKLLDYKALANEIYI